MAPTIRIVSLRVGETKRPSDTQPPDTPRSDSLFRPNAPDAAGGPVLSYHTGQKIPRERRAEVTGTDDVKGMKLCGKRRKNTGTLPFPHDVHRGGSAPCSAGEKQTSGGSSPATGASLRVRPPRIARKSTRPPSATGTNANGDGRRQKKRTAVVPAALRALSASAGRPCESAFTISTDACVRSRRG